VLPPIRLQVRIILVAPRRSHYHHHHHYHHDRKYDTKFTRILYIYTHTKGSCKQSSTAVKPRNHIEAPLKNPFPTQDPSLPQPFTKLGEKNNPSAQTHLSLLPPPLALVLNHSSQKKKGKHPPQKTPKKTRQNKTQNQKKKQGNSTNLFTNTFLSHPHLRSPLTTTASASRDNEQSNPRDVTWCRRDDEEEGGERKTATKPKSNNNKALV
jgi:hypothetical protein